MSDRELLESAAKAAGYKLERFISALYPYATIYTVKGKQWDPLADDGDTLRLAVELGLSVSTGILSVSTGIDWAEAKIDELTPIREFAHKDYQDIFAATRRAIVRAAAEIGRQMQEGGAA